MLLRSNWRLSKLLVAEVERGRDMGMPEDQLGEREAWKRSTLFPDYETVSRYAEVFNAAHKSVASYIRALLQAMEAHSGDKVDLSEFSLLMKKLGDLITTNRLNHTSNVLTSPMDIAFGIGNYAPDAMVSIVNLMRAPKPLAIAKAPATFFNTPSRVNPDYRLHGLTQGRGRADHTYNRHTGRWQGHAGHSLGLEMHSESWSCVPMFDSWSHFRANLKFFIYRPPNVLARRGTETLWGPGCQIYH